jgi:GntR family transcriptional regulator
MVEDLPFELQRKGGLPIYLQVKRKVESFISSGHWKKGQRLPTERSLAQKLGVSRNTVSLAYRQLEAEGLITSRQGRGTFVSEADDILRLENKRERLARIIDVAIEDALSLGSDLDEILTMAEKRVQERRRLMMEIKIGFIECNREQLDYFAKELELGTGVHVIPVLIENFKAVNQEARRRIQEADLIVTTFFHLDDVRRLFPNHSADILGIALDPVMESIVKIARLPQGTNVLLCCISEAFAERVLKSMELAGISELDVEVTISKDPLELKKALAGKRALIVSPGRYKEVASMVKRGTQIIEFIYQPDAASVNLLRASVLAHRKKNKQEAVDRGSSVTVGD